MKLTIELVPRPCWHKSLSKLHALGLFPEWYTIQMESRRKYDEKCALCGFSEIKPTRFSNVSCPGGKPLHCHEVWNYDDEKCVQTLADVIPLCNMCHHVKHLGLAEVLASQGKLDYKTVIDHFLQVNDVKQADFEREARAAFALFSERSKKEWTTHFGPYNALVDPYFVKDWNLAVSCEDDAVTFEEESDDNKPSTIKTKAWVSAFCKKPLHMIGTEGRLLYPGNGVGTWLVKGRVEEIDALWPLIKEATEQASLGIKAFALTGVSKSCTRIIGVVVGQKQDINTVAMQIAGLGYKGTVRWKDAKTKQIEREMELGGIE